MIINLQQDEAACIPLEQPENPRSSLPRLAYQLVLPFPPSVNRLWRYVGRGKIIRSADYEAWLKTADGCVLEQLGIPAYRRPIRGRYTMKITLDEFKFGKVDADNCVKAVCDLLQRNNVISNDKNAWKIILMWQKLNAKNEGKPTCIVKVEEFRELSPELPVFTDQT